MYKRILVPLDGSKLSEHVLPSVRILGNAFGSSIELLRVVPARLQGQITSNGSLEPGRRLNLHTQSLDYLNHVKKSLDHSDVGISCLVEENDAGSCIAREAQRDPDTLIAISTHGRMGVGRWVLGTVMDKVLRTADKPMLVVRPGVGEVTAPDAEISLKSVIGTDRRLTFS